MYENIGSKIKTLARWTFYVEAIAAIIGGIVLIVEDIDMLPISLLVMAVGLIVAYVGSWLLYGFGEIIDKLCDIERNTHGNVTKSDTQLKAESERVGKLEKLRAKGLITEEEYQMAAAKGNGEG